MKTTAAAYLHDAKIGDLIWTEPMGEWPGGYARIIELEPDPNAPEIVFQVEGANGQGDIGVFGYERIMVITHRAR